MTFYLTVIFQNVLVALLLILVIAVIKIILSRIIPAKFVVRIVNSVNLQIGVHRAMKAMS